MEQQKQQSSNTKPPFQKQPRCRPLAACSIITKKYANGSCVAISIQQQNTAVVLFTGQDSSVLPGPPRHNIQIYDIDRYLRPQKRWAFFLNPWSGEALQDMKHYNAIKYDIVTQSNSKALSKDRLGLEHPTQAASTIMSIIALVTLSWKVFKACHYEIMHFLLQSSQISKASWPISRRFAGLLRYGTFLCLTHTPANLCCWTVTPISRDIMSAEPVQFFQTVHHQHEVKTHTAAVVCSMLPLCDSSSSN